MQEIEDSYNLAVDYYNNKQFELAYEQYFYLAENKGV